MIDILAEAMQAVPIINYLPTPPSELTRTWGSIVSAAKAFNFSPQVSIYDGIARFVDWFTAYKAPVDGVIPMKLYHGSGLSEQVANKRLALQAHWLSTLTPMAC